MKTNEEIFKSIIKGTNIFTPIVDSYHKVGNYIIEISCAEKDNISGKFNIEVNGFTFRNKWGVTVIQNVNGKWERATNLNKLCDSYEEVKEYIKSLK